MKRHLWRALRVGGLCLLSGCASPQCDPEAMVAVCDIETQEVSRGLRADTPTCDAIDEALRSTFNQDLSNQGSGGTPGGGTGGGTPGDE